MRIDVPKELKDREPRVALTPEGARQLVEQGHEVGSKAKPVSAFDMRTC